MKIGMNEILSGIEHAATQKIARGLEKEGFVVKSMYSPSEGTRMLFDLYAEKGDDKRIYELKIGKNKIQRRQFEALQAEAKQLGAKLYIVYLEIPRSNEICFEGLEEIIFNDLLNDTPSEIDSLSTHTTIEDIADIEIDSIDISKGIAKLEGSGTINVHFQFGSKSDIRNGDGVTDMVSVDFFFKLSVDISTNKICKRYYKIDTEK